VPKGLCAEPKCPTNASGARETWLRLLAVALLVGYLLPFQDSE